MLGRLKKAPIGMRTAKTVLAVVLAMLIVDAYGATDSRLIFAMLGATAAMLPTFKESLESCVAQVVGVLFGAVAGLFLRHLPMPMLVNTGLGIALVIVLYNWLQIPFSPSMPIFMVVLLCTTPDIEAMPYAFGRVWDSAIGLGVGMLINTLVFPYDNSRQIRATVESLDRELIAFLEEMFDGDAALPESEAMADKLEAMGAQLDVFSNQRLFYRWDRQRRELRAFRVCHGKAQQLLAQLEVLRHIGVPGSLSDENRRRLVESGAHIGEYEAKEADAQRDIVTNYHVAQVLTLPSTRRAVSKT